jgi:ribosylpyrimidine nucleosidase
MSQTKQKIILDVDPGHDDAAAIMLAAVAPNIDLLAITVVAGNQTLEKTSINALNVCSVAGISNIPVAAGMSRPLVREQVIAANIHGETGLDGPHFGEPTVKLDKRHAVDLIIELLMRSEGDITLVPTGPLTNIAMAIRKEPRIVPKIKQIVLMGGAYQLGNYTPAAEFNIYADPEAAHIVFTCGRPITMMGLDLTRQALARQEEVARIRSIGNKASILFAELMEFFSKTQKEVFGWDAPPLHDPTTIAWLIDPTCIETKPMYVAIELRGEHTYGRTVCDYYGVTGKQPNAQVAIKLNYRKFWDIMYDTYKLYER